MLPVAGIGGSTLNRDVNLIDDPHHPDVAADCCKEVAVVRALPCDSPLGAHDRHVDPQAQYERLAAGDRDAFVDLEGCRRVIDQSQRAFAGLLANEQVLVADGKPAGR